MPKQNKPTKGKGLRGGDDARKIKTNSKSVPISLPKKAPKKTEAQHAYERNRARALDDDDEFQEGADKVTIGKAQQDSDDSDGERYDQAVSDQDSEEEEDDEEEAGGLGGEEDDDDEDEEAYESKRAKMLKAEANTAKAWGKNKKGFYGAETGEYELMGEDERVAIEEEEAESRRLQAEATADLDERDLDVSSLEVLLAAKPKAGKAGKMEAGFRDDELLSALKKDLSELQAEKLSKDVSQMEDSEKFEVLKAESPELLALLDEAKPQLAELRNYLHPLIQKIRQLPTQEAEGISFLELKNRVLLTYCTNLCFYLLLKAEGKSVKKHPVLKVLATLRTVSEKIRSIDSKLKYQIDKLLKMAALGPNHQKSKKDPLSFKPNVGEMVAKTSEEAEDQAGVYQAPKITPVTFDADEKQLAKDKAKKARARAKAEKSGLLSEFRDELAERPQEIKHMGGYKPQADFLREREEFEEDQFMRLMETKADRKRRVASQKIRAQEELDDLGDFGDLHALTEAASTKQYGSKYDKIADKKAAKPAPWKMDDDSMAAGKALYEKSKLNSKQKKEAHKAAHPNRVYAYGKVDPNLVEEGTRRQAGGQIVKNRGLTRSRPKISSNPRAAKRAKFDKALVKRASTVKEYKGKVANYSGEASGIKTNVIKSTKL